jgi:RHS repeat-associated protein
MKNLINIIVVLLLVLSGNFYAVADKITYVHTDVLGSPVAETDESGNIIWTEHYSPFGEKVDNLEESIDNSVGYTGHQHDSDTGLTYMQARYYDPVIGRFYSNDPVGFNGVHSFNRYAYANNNPYRYTDPNGEYPESWAEVGNLALGVGTVMGAAGQAIAGMAMTAVGAADVVVGSKITGAALITGGVYAMKASTYSAEKGANKISAAWNNKTGEVKDTTPEGPITATLTSELGKELGCGQTCADVATFTDKVASAATGNLASGVKALGTVHKVLTEAGNASTAAETVSKLPEKERK